MRFFEGFAVEGPQFGVDGLGIVVAQETETGVDVALEKFAVDFAEAGEDFDEERKEGFGRGGGTLAAEVAIAKTSEEVRAGRGETLAVGEARTLFARAGCRARRRLSLFGGCGRRFAHSRGT